MSVSQGSRILSFLFLFFYFFFFTFVSQALEIRFNIFFTRKPKARYKNNFLLKIKRENIILGTTVEIFTVDEELRLRVVSELHYACPSDQSAALRAL